MVGIDKQITKRLKLSKQGSASIDHDNFATPWTKLQAR
jgi:hypothetical protein